MSKKNIRDTRLPFIYRYGVYDGWEKKKKALSRQLKTKSNVHDSLSIVIINCRYHARARARHLIYTIRAAKQQVADNFD